MSDYLASSDEKLHEAIEANEIISTRTNNVKEYNVAILGATGAVVKECDQLLINHSVKVKLLARVVQLGTVFKIRIKFNR